jgi:hypothetical protein
VVLRWERSGRQREDRSRLDGLALERRGKADNERTVPKGSAWSGKVGFGRIGEAATEWAASYLGTGQEWPGLADVEWWSPVAIGEQRQGRNGVERKRAARRGSLGEGGQVRPTRSRMVGSRVVAFGSVRCGRLRMARSGRSSSVRSGSERAVGPGRYGMVPTP